MIGIFLKRSCLCLLNFFKLCYTEGHDKKTAGKIILDGRSQPWEHEMRVARILSRDGHNVEFIPPALTRTADILLDGVEFEIKSPQGNKLTTIERNLKRATKQSRNIVFDSSRMKQMSDRKILQNIIYHAKHQKLIKRVIFIGKNGKITDLTF